ncbi:MAG: PTS sugar transporter subunit IIA [Gemmatimonadota bacterium]|nr:MAG: PTS sugar transporter subunit IIA [Gemmatimonadota bacterium]
MKNTRIPRIWRLLKAKTIALDLSERIKEKAIEELIDLLVEAKLLPDKTRALENVLKREEMISTGIGEGVALPHAKYDKITQPLLALGRSEEGLKFDSLDGKKVHLVFLLLSPQDDPAKYVKLLGKIARLLDSKELRDAVRKAESQQEIIETIKEAERRLR